MPRKKKADPSYQEEARSYLEQLRAAQPAEEPAVSEPQVEESPSEAPPPQQAEPTPTLPPHLMGELERRLVELRRKVTYSATVENNRWIKQTPHAKQKEFLLLSDQMEILFGGAAGPGKSSALLMGALQFVEVPNYSAIIFRKTYANLSKPGALMDRARDWLANTEAVWKEAEHTWRFPSGATLTFGYLDNETDKYHYNSAEFQYVAFDELTEFREHDYRYLFSRLRRSKANETLPIRMRAASNPGGEGHCVPYGEVLTPKGWKDIRSFKVGDPVYAVNSKRVLVESEVVQVHENDYDGDLIDVDVRGLRMRCTPNHRVAKVGGTKRKKDRKYSLVPFDSLPGQATVLRSVKIKGKSIADFTPERLPGRKRKHDQPESLSGVEFAELFGWFVSEGCTVDRDKAFQIAQMKLEQRGMIASLLDRCGFIYSISKVGFTVYAPDWWNYFSKFGHSRDKYIPAVLKSASRIELWALFCSMVEGDGHWVLRERSGEYYTISSRLADDFAEIAVKLGFIVSQSSRQRENRDGLSYCINFKRTKSRGTELLTGNHVYDVTTETKRKSRIKRIPHKGKVYCIGVPKHHAFVIRQKGSVWVSGNSWVYDRFFERGEKEGRVYMPATLEDNPSIDRDEYIKTLGELDPITLEQLLKGNWTARHSGSIFKREWFQIVDNLPNPREVVQCVRAWDLAATDPKKDKTQDPDWTVGVKMCRTIDGTFWVLHVIRVRATPGSVEQLIYETAKLDGQTVPVIIEREMGASGKFLAEHFLKLLAGWTFHSSPTGKSGGKVARATPFACQAYGGKVKIIRSDWTSKFLDECEGFPITTFDDQVDAASYALRYITDNCSYVYGIEGVNSHKPKQIWEMYASGQGSIYRDPRFGKREHNVGFGTMQGRRRSGHRLFG